jgi:hypothetical protein
MALVIANTNGLDGTKIDIINFVKFLKSNHGGAWLNSEIHEPLYNPSLDELKSALGGIKRNNYDYVIVLFSGHGGQIRETILEINGDEEVIAESQLKNLAPRQLTIFDCCRVLPSYKADDAIMSKSTMHFSESAIPNLREIIRKKYNERIMEAIPQQATLYSCSINESSYDTTNGAVYLTNLLDAAKKINREFKLVGVAHQEAKAPTIEYSLRKHTGIQTPDQFLPKCLSNQQLIISINPDYYIDYS